MTLEDFHLGSGTRAGSLLAVTLAVDQRRASFVIPRLGALAQADRLDPRHVLVVGFVSFHVYRAVRARPLPAANAFPTRTLSPVLTSNRIARINLTVLADPVIYAIAGAEFTFTFVEALDTSARVDFTVYATEAADTLTPTVVTFRAVQTDEQAEFIDYELI